MFKNLPVATDGGDREDHRILDRQPDNKPAEVAGTQSFIEVQERAADTGVDGKRVSGEKRTCGRLGHVCHPLPARYRRCWCCQGTGRGVVLLWVLRQMFTRRGNRVGVVERVWL